MILVKLNDFPVPKNEENFFNVSISKENNPCKKNGQKIKF